MINNEKYGCLIIKIPIKNWDKILSKIDKKDLYINKDSVSDGLEKDPHITILYGFHDETDVNKMKKLLKDKTVNLSIDKMSLFENDEYDVLKFNVISNDLAKLNKLMKVNFEYTSTYPNYIPHLTIAYLKKGEGKKYIKNMETLEIENINNFIYFDKDYKETKL
jgi:2'-5' RNA ligase